MVSHIWKGAGPIIRIVVVDDHPHAAVAMRAMLKQTTDIQLVAEAYLGEDIFFLVQRTRPDVLFLDSIMEPEFDALTAVKTLSTNYPTLKICMLSAHVEPSHVRNMLQAGASGYILKNDDYMSNIETIIRRLVAGELYLSLQAYQVLAQATRQAGQETLLTARETDILRLAARGLPNPQIAQNLHLSTGTVRNNLCAVYRKLNVHGRQDALRVAKERGFV